MSIHEIELEFLNADINVCTFIYVYIHLRMFHRSKGAWAHHHGVALWLSFSVWFYSVQLNGGKVSITTTTTEKQLINESLSGFTEVQIEK